MQVNKTQSQDRTWTRQTKVVGMEGKELEGETVKNVDKKAPVDI